MVWPYARRIVAPVQDANTWRYISVRVTPRDAMRTDRSTTTPHHSVALRLFGARPDPTRADIWNVRRDWPIAIYSGVVDESRRGARAGHDATTSSAGRSAM